MKSAIVAMLFVMVAVTSRAAEPPDSDLLAARPADLQWWREARFGLFIHWGPVSIKGTEIGWSRGGERRGTGGTGEIPVEVYDNLYKQFNPTSFDARQWVALAKAAGMKYLVFTTKHHDGFCMFDSRLTDYKITNSPFKRDVTAELAQACHEAGLKLGFYYSPPDWRHADYRNANHARYIEYMHGHLRELCTNYGRVDILWFDGLGGSAKDWDATRLLPMIRRLQPGIIINNRAGLPADHDTPEQEIGRFQTNRPWETCMTICQQWAWKPNDQLKSLAECIHTLVRCAGGDGNLLFNVGPMPTGEIEARQVERLKEMGQWLAKNGKAIYATRGGPFRPGRWGAATCSGDTVYVHVLKWEGAELELPAIDRKILSAELLAGGAVECRQDAEGIRLRVAEAKRDPLDTIIALKLDGPAFEAKVAPATRSLAHGKKARASNFFQGDSTYAPGKALDGDDGTRWATDSGTHQAWIEVDLGAPTSFSRAHIAEAYSGRVQRFELQVQREGQWVTIARGQRIGDSLDLKFEPVTAQLVRLNILEATEGPTIWEFELLPR